MPFQLYPELPSGYSNPGVPKDDVFRELLQQRAPEMTPQQRLDRVKPLMAAWKAEGLVLKSPPTGLNEGNGGLMGSSFDAQRLILLARRQGCEHQMIEQIYSANHQHDRCLGDWSVLLECAEKAGVKLAREALESGWGMAETRQKIEYYRDIGISAVPVLMLEKPFRALISNGAPEKEFLVGVLSSLVQHGALPWRAEQLPALPPVEDSEDDMMALGLVGKLVQVHGLAGRAELNGAVGMCERYCVARRRLAVLLKGLSEPVAIKAANLTVLQKEEEEVGELAGAEEAAGQVPSDEDEFFNAYFK